MPGNFTLNAIQKKLRHTLRKFNLEPEIFMPDSFACYYKEIQFGDQALQAKKINQDPEALEYSEAEGDNALKKRSNGVK